MGGETVSEFRSDPEIERGAQYYKRRFDEISREIARIVVGQDEIVSAMIEAILSNGHVLVEGVPGIGKTLLVRSMALITGCQFSRIQFTPDLLPTDIVGITTYEEGRGFFTIKGPVFANFVLADEINRAPPKVQSALLQSMQEREATIGKETFQLPTPFFVMATQNPVEHLGTYKLPEAQVDRFIFKLLMGYPSMDEEREILQKNITLNKLDDFNLKAALTPTEIVETQRFTKKVYLDPKLENYIVRIVDTTRNPQKYGVESGKYIGFGGSPRSSISMFIAAKAHALVKGRAYATAQDVKEVAANVLRHRIILNFEGEAENVNTDDIIEEILHKVPVIE